MPLDFTSKLLFASRPSALTRGKLAAWMDALSKPRSRPQGAREAQPAATRSDASGAQDPAYVSKRPQEQLR